MHLYNIFSNILWEDSDKFEINIMNIKHMQLYIYNQCFCCLIKIFKYSKWFENEIIMKLKKNSHNNI